MSQPIPFKRCRQCQHPTPLDTAQCPKCGNLYRTRFAADGTPLPADDLPTQAYPQAFRPLPSPPPPRPRGRRHPWFWPLFALLFSLPVLFLGMIVLMGQDPPDTAHQTKKKTTTMPAVSPEDPPRIIWYANNDSFAGGTLYNRTDKPLDGVRIYANRYTLGMRSGYIGPVDELRAAWWDSNGSDKERSKKPYGVDPLPPGGMREPTKGATLAVTIPPNDSWSFMMPTLLGAMPFSITVLDANGNELLVEQDETKALREDRERRERDRQMNIDY